MKRILSLLLVLTLCLGMLPANVWAEAAEEATEYVETTEETEETEGTTLPAEPEETEPAEEESAEEEPEVVETEAADGPETVETVTLEPVTEVWINPEYRDLFSEADIGASDISGFEGEGTPCSSPEEVIEALREGLVNRQENPTATLVTTRAYHEETRFLTDIQDSLFDHTGAPKEGDYLRRDIGYSEITMGISGTTQDGVTTWTYTFILTDVNYFTTAAQEREMDQEVSRVLSSLALDGKSQKEKIDAIYNYLIRNVKYVSDAELADESNVIKYSSYAALVRHNAVCQGFAGAFYRLCLESGIDSRIVSSDAMNHAWNIVELGGSYYHLDATWDINWPNAPKYYLKGTTYWKAEHRSSTTGDISELGDQFADGSFAAAYPVPEGDYGENTSTYYVTIVYTKIGNVVAYATAELTLKEITDLKMSNASNAKQILAKTSGASVDDDKIIDAYRGSMNTCFSYMAIIGNEIEIGVTKNLSNSATADSDTATVTVVDGSLTDTRELTVGKSYFDYDLVLGNNKKILASVRITYEVNGKTYTRTAKKGDSDAKVQAYDTQVELLWDAKQVTINFYRNIANGAEQVSAMTIRDGEIIECLPKLDGEKIDWYMEDGTLLETGRAYDFPSTTVRAFPTPLGDCGENLKWMLERDSGYLTISGTGDMWNFSGDAPWIEFQDEIRSLRIKHGVNSIGNWAFYGCGFTGTLDLPATVRTVGYSAFQGCTGITDLNFSDGLETIGAEAFAGCTGIQGELNLPNSVSIVDDYAFYGCENIRGNAYLSADLKRVGTGAFSGTDIDSFSVSEDNTSFVSVEGILFTIDEETLLMVPCGMTGKVEIPIGTRTVASNAFIGCDRITSLLIRDGRLSRFESGAFDGCSGLTDVYYNGSLAQWQAIQGHEQLDDKNIHTTAESYIISFDGNGAEIGSMKNLEATVDAAVTLPEASFINPGYTFTSWNTQANGKGESYQPGDQVKNLAESGTVTLYAQWRPSTYTAIFLPGADDCKGSVKDMPNLVNGKSYVFPKCGYTRTGYQFAGWGVERADDLIWNAGDKLKMTRVEEGYVAEFVARWTPITYTVRFNANKGTGKMLDQKGIPYDESTTLSPCTFTRTGYRFLGWNTKANGIGETVDEALNLTATNKGTVTLYAQWEGEPYDVTFHFGEEIRTQTLHYGTAEALAGNPFENPGYTFKCWTTLESGKGKSYKDGAKVTSLSSGEDVDLYAQWTANKYTVVFHSNLTKDTTKKQTLTYDGKETALTANGFSWKGHAFQGWAEAEDAAEPEYTNKGKVRNLTTEKTVDLYAVWKVNEYTVVFDPNGADGEEVAQDMTYDVPAELEANRFERTGYTFSGWATTAKGKAVYTDGKEVKNLTDKDGVAVRLYAVWSPTTYTVSFEPGAGSTGTMKPMKMIYGKTYTLTGVSFKRANYTFAGWRDAETGETYANKAKVSDLSADGGTVTLVAQWKPTEYAITYRNVTAMEQEKLPKSFNVLSEGFPKEPSRPGCEFVGWFLDSGCKKPFTGFENIAKPGKLTLYPKWVGTPSKYTIHFDPGAEDVTGKMADKKNLVCGKDYTLANNAFKRSGWQFAGWEIGGVTLGNKAKFSNLPAYLKDFVSGGTVTLTAKWVQPGDGGDIPLK